MTVAYVNKVNKDRVAIAFGIAPMLPSVFLAFASILLNSGQVRFMELFFILMFSLPFSYLPCAALLLLFWRYAIKRRLLNCLYVSIFGILFGMVVSYLFSIILATLLGTSAVWLPNFSNLIEKLQFGGFFGALVALPFSLIAGFPLLPARRDRISEQKGT